MGRCQGDTAHSNRALSTLFFRNDQIQLDGNGCCGQQHLSGYEQ